MSDNAELFVVPAHLLENALKDGTLLHASPDGDKRIARPLSVVRVGGLTVRSGQLIVGDVGMAFDMAEPFVRRVKPGQYDVFASIWGLKGRGDSPSDEMGDAPRGAYLCVVFSAMQPVGYEFAATGDQPIDWRPSDSYDGFGVDVGGVGILDAADLDAVRGLPESTDFIELTERATSPLAEHKGTTGLVTLPTNPPLVVPFCESGWGDGSYFSYWGLDAQGEPAALIIDFNLDNKWKSY